MREEPSQPRAADEAAHAVAAAALGFSLPDVLLSVGRHSYLAWRPRVHMWFEAPYVREPSRAARLAFIDALVTVDAAPRALALAAGDERARDRGSIAPGYYWPYPDEFPLPDEPEAFALWLLTEKFGLMGRTYLETPGIEDDADGAEVWETDLRDEFLAMAEAARARLAGPLASAHAQVAAELHAAGTLPFARVLEIMRASGVSVESR
ncbi:MAG: hypothetical protein AB7I36_09150 [Rhodospirillaceae bacterium]